MASGRSAAAIWPVWVKNNNEAKIAKPILMFQFPYLLADATEMTTQLFPEGRSIALPLLFARE